MPFLAAAVPFIVAGAAIAGVGLSAYGAITQANAAKKLSEAQQQQSKVQASAMALDNRRRRIEAIRQGQMARAQAVANANSQGALTGSGLQGGLGQITGQQNLQTLGLSEGLNLGYQNFAADASITSARADASVGAAFGSLGGTLISSLGPINNLSGGFRPSKQA